MTSTVRALRQDVVSWRKRDSRQLRFPPETTHVGLLGSQLHLTTIVRRPTVSAAKKPFQLSNSWKLDCTHVGERID
jgi:hypothetical protein